MGPLFSANRMVQSYTRGFYMPADKRSHDLVRDDLAIARELASWRARVREAWPKVRFVEVETEGRGGLKVGGAIDVRARVDLGGLSPRDVLVEVYEGDVNASGDLVRGRAQALRAVEEDGDGIHQFRGWVACERSGRIGLAVRVRPSRRDLECRVESELIRWA
jgi:starch phosphorylase